MHAGAPLAFDSLLWLCACPRVSEEHSRALAQRASSYASWQALPAAVEAHGISPLADLQLSQAGVIEHVPKDVRMQLRGLAMRHRRANKTRATLIAEMADAFAAQSVPLLFAKGAALAFDVYPTPDLRAMRDLDVLVHEEHLARAGELLRTLGYETSDEATWATTRDHPHHQPSRKRLVDSFAMTVEVHRRLGIEDPRARRTMAELLPSARSFAVGGSQAQTLGHEDMLVHVHYHGFRTPLSWPDRARLGPAADLSMFVSKLHASIDWTQVDERAPHLRESLAWLHYLVPFAPEALNALRPNEVAGALDVGDDYQGYKRGTRNEGGDYAKQARDALAPPNWWLRLRHGGARGPVGYAQSWLRHARELF